MNTAHLEKFIEHKDDSLSFNQLVGSNVFTWWQNVSEKLPDDLELKSYHLPNDLPVDDDKGLFLRQSLKNMCRDHDKYDDRDCLISIMAWGGYGSQKKKVNSLFGNYCKYAPIISAMRQGKIDHLEAFKEFYDLIVKGDSIGMWAPYFTKLIFFCHPDHKGYIMDQWTAKSMNLIMGRQVVQMDGDYVSWKNTAENYHDFCEGVERLAEKLKQDPEDIERAMFSYNKRWPWRQYVIENFSS